MRNGRSACTSAAEAPPALHDHEEQDMKTPTLIRVAALVAAAATTFVLVQSVALLALPPPGAALQIAQAAMPVLPR
jgi:hypothetical protein